MTELTRALNTPPSEVGARKDALNAVQRQAVEHGASPTGGVDPDAPPLLIVAGAGTGKTTTLAHRVAHLVACGVSPERILLLTFTRRAAADLCTRAQEVLRQRTGAAEAILPWAGTFHSAANRLLRSQAQAVGLDPSFSVLDRGDAADLMDWLRGEQGLAQQRRRFPRKHACLGIYSHVINTQGSLEESLEAAFPWCAEWADELRALFAAYVDAKQERNLLDYDDLLLYWHALMEEEALAESVRECFDAVLVDEYQDTNRLQAEIVRRLSPSGFGVTAVGDDAQAIYAFRGADVRNILDFPRSFEREARVLALEQNYRSTRPILAACNDVIALASERHEKWLFSERPSEQRPWLVAADDEQAQLEYVVQQVLMQREAGVLLQRQAVLFRASHHSDRLEVELARRNIPFVKFGGLKFLEAAHVKDLLSVLRWAENPKDGLAGFRVLQLMPGVGPATASRALGQIARRGFRFEGLAAAPAPAAAAPHWSALRELMDALVPEREGDRWGAQLSRVRAWYEPLLEGLYDGAPGRVSDLDQLEQLAGGYPSRERFLTELALDPPEATGDHARDPLLDEDFLTLSTIHSAKGQEWDSVFLLNVVDGCIPSDLATRDPDDVEEERRLLYVAMSRARDQLHVIQPLRFDVKRAPRSSDAHLYAPRSRFIPSEILGRFERRPWARAGANGRSRLAMSRPSVRVDVAAKLRKRWS